MTTVSNEKKATAKQYLENLFKVLEDILKEADKKNASGLCCDLKNVEEKLKLLKADFTDESCAILYEVAFKLEDYEKRVNTSFSQKFRPLYPPKNN